MVELGLLRGRAVVLILRAAARALRHARVVEPDVLDLGVGLQVRLDRRQLRAGLVGRRGVFPPVADEEDVLENSNF